MHRSAKKCTPNYLKPTASSMAQRHPRAAKLIDAQYSSLRRRQLNKQPALRRTQSCMTETPMPTYMKDTVSSRAKQKGKVDRGTSVGVRWRLDVERCSQMKRCKRAPSSLSDGRSIGDSALDDASGIKRSTTMPVVPAIAKKDRVPMKSQSSDTAAVVLTVLFRMNKPKSVVRDVFDIVVAINRKKQKTKENEKRRSKEALIKTKLTQVIPGLKDLLDYIRDLSFTSLLKFVHRRAFLVAFPLVLLQLVAQFPSLLNVILGVTRGHWRHAFISDDLYYLHALVGCLFPLRTFLPSF